MKIKVFFRSLWILSMCLLAHRLDAQDIDIGAIGKGKAFKINGGLSASGIYYHSDQNNNREPFTYYLQGNLNLSFYQFSMPVSYSYSNLGSQLDYELPFKLNRLSLHPRYKWIQGHIGDIAMTFSPYTLNAHQFTGGGIELTPPGPFSFSAMTGQLLRATKDDGDVRSIPAFKRMGYGAKFGYLHQRFKLGLIGFYAKDDINSIPVVPDDKDITPKENLVISLEGMVKIIDNLELSAEYASSAITQDLRAERQDLDGKNLAGLLFNNRASTEYYAALKTALNYHFDKYSIGVGYERIDPGYVTLGAYYFNNDFENITLNGTSSLFKDVLNLSFNIGYQRDDLKKQKESATNRTVGAIQANIHASDRLNIGLSYSNFTTFTNAKLDQFDVINDDNLADNITEQLNYKQLSQNANLNINYLLSKTERLQQVINFNYALADVANEQNEVVRVGDASTFHNFNTSHMLGFPNKRITFTTAINLTYNTIGTTNAKTWGPTLSINKKLFEDKMNASIAGSYSSNDNQGVHSDVTNVRASVSYMLLEKHNFNLNAIQLFRNVPSGKNQETTVTFGYNYSF